MLLLLHKKRNLNQISRIKTKNINKNLEKLFKKREKQKECNINNFTEALFRTGATK